MFSSWHYVIYWVILSIVPNQRHHHSVTCYKSTPVLHSFCLLYDTRLISHLPWWDEAKGSKLCCCSATPDSLWYGVCVWCVCVCVCVCCVCVCVCVLCVCVSNGQMRVDVNTGSSGSRETGTYLSLQRSRASDAIFFRLISLSPL